MSRTAATVVPMRTTDVPRNQRTSPQWARANRWACDHANAVIDRRGVPSARVIWL